jgi:hypothetical protein
VNHEKTPYIWGQHQSPPPSQPPNNWREQEDPPRDQEDPLDSQEEEAPDHQDPLDNQEVPDHQDHLGHQEEEVLDHLMVEQQRDSQGQEAMAW